MIVKCLLRLLHTFTILGFLVVFGFEVQYIRFHTITLFYCLLAWILCTKIIIALRPVLSGVQRQCREVPILEIETGLPSLQ